MIRLKHGGYKGNCWPVFIETAPRCSTSDKKKARAVPTKYYGIRVSLPRLPDMNGSTLTRRTY